MVRLSIPGEKELKIMVPIPVPGDAADKFGVVMLENERTELRHSLENGLAQTITSLIRKDFVHTDKTISNKIFGSITHTWHHFGIHDSFVISAYLRELSRLAVWPLNLQQMKVSEVLEKLSSFEEKEISTAFGFRIFGRNPQCQACMLDTRTQVAKLVDKIASEAKGLCLDCIKNGDSQGMECRVKHD